MTEWIAKARKKQTSEAHAFAKRRHLHPRSVSRCRPFAISRSSSAPGITSSRWAWASNMGELSRVSSWHGERSTLCFAERFPAVVEIRRWYSLNLNIAGCFRKEDRESAKGRKRERRESDGWQAANVSRAAATRSLILFAVCFALSPFRVFAILFRAAGHVVAMGMGAEHG